MTTIDVLASAAALREFDAPALASLSEEDEYQVEAVIKEHWEFFTEAGSSPEATSLPRWRVTDVRALRAHILSLSPDAPVPSNQAMVIDVAADPRLGYAEEILVECAGASGNADRTLRISTALNLAQQCAAEASYATRKGHHLSPTNDDLPALVRIDLILARLAQGDAKKLPKRRYLRVGERALESLHGVIAEPRRERLLRTFVSLTRCPSVVCCDRRS